jgi:hypothetical protein
MSRRRIALWVALIAIALVVGLGVIEALRLRPHIVALVARAEDLRALAEGGVGMADGGSLERLRGLLDDTHRDLLAIQSEAEPFLALACLAGWLPRVGGDVEAAPELLDMAVHLSDAGWWAILGAEPVVDVLGSGVGSAGVGGIGAALPVLAASRPRLAEAQKALAEARSACERVDQRRLSPRLANWMERLSRYLPACEAALALAQRAPELLGQDRPVTYLLLAQNNQELRATGGFISGVGVIRVDRGKLVDVTFGDSYQVDERCDLASHPPAPAALRQYMWAPALMFRDANWSPDFPTSAAVATSIYRLCNRELVDGVIAVDLDGAARLLGALGPLQPEGYPKAVSSDTLLQFVAEYWTAPLQSASMTQDLDEWWGHRKDFMADLLGAALAKVTTDLGALDGKAAAGALLQALQERHLLVSLADAGGQRALADAGWDGAIQPTGSDYLMVVDSNVGFRKVNPYIRQEVRYAVDLGDRSRPAATLTVRYANASPGPAECIAGSRYDGPYAEMTQGCYWDYVRVYVPEGSQLLGLTGSDGDAGISTDGDKTVFSAFAAVAPGQSRELVFRYALPPSVLQPLSARYALLLQKQPGRSSLPTTVTVTGGHGAWEAGTGMTASMADGACTTELAADTRVTWVAAGNGAVSPWLWAVLGAAGVASLAYGLFSLRTASDDRGLDEAA